MSTRPTASNQSTVVVLSKPQADVLEKALEEQLKKIRPEIGDTERRAAKLAKEARDPKMLQATQKELAYLRVNKEFHEARLKLVRKKLDWPQPQLLVWQKKLAAAKGEVVTSVSHAQAASPSRVQPKLSSPIAPQVKRPQINASHVSVARPQLKLPPAYEVPPKAVVVKTQKLIRASVVRKPGEPLASLQSRQDNLIRRSLVRYVKLRTEQPKVTSAAAAVDTAVIQTIQQDTSAINAEQVANGGQGGTVPDPAADAMNYVVDQVGPPAGDLPVDATPLPPTPEMVAAEELQPQSIVEEKQGMSTGAKLGLAAALAAGAAWYLGAF